eukprot:CAMPEP_0194267912 /NCGR_PEP_ID=MMETSP0169-20130528/2331_1 /TAXON_ID=218684 /ORGANISM="Corethron pennatum, Strain L29A3" /LENGTH=56 /DNA_ID=CAMNT_0039008943 /DNA_START=917 /DNA_END=1087 /DNA_ORIENTATION=-
MRGTNRDVARKEDLVRSGRCRFADSILLDQLDPVSMRPFVRRGINTTDITFLGCTI